MSAKALLERPAKVLLAVKLLYGVVAIGVVRMAMTVIRHADVRSPHFLVGTKLCLYAVSLFLIFQIGQGKNWARWSLVVILVINTPLTILPNLESLTHNPVHALLGYSQLALYLYVLVLLFRKTSSDWFQQG